MAVSRYSALGSSWAETGQPSPAVAPVCGGAVSGVVAGRWPSATADPSLSCTSPASSEACVTHPTPPQRGSRKRTATQPSDLPCSPSWPPGWGPTEGPSTKHSVNLRPTSAGCPGQPHSRRFLQRINHPEFQSSRRTFTLCWDHRFSPMFWNFDGLRTAWRPPTKLLEMSRCASASSRTLQTPGESPRAAGGAALTRNKPKSLFSESSGRDSWGAGLHPQPRCWQRNPWKQHGLP